MLPRGPRPALRLARLSYDQRAARDRPWPEHPTRRVK